MAGTAADDRLTVYRRAASAVPRRTRSTWSVATVHRSTTAGRCATDGSGSAVLDGDVAGRFTRCRRGRRGGCARACCVTSSITAYPMSVGLLSLGLAPPFPAGDAVRTPDLDRRTGRRRGFSDCCCRPSIWCGPTARPRCRSTRTTRCRVMPAPGFVVQGTRHDGIVRLLNHGSDHAPSAEPRAPTRSADPPSATQSHRPTITTTGSRTDSHRAGDLARSGRQPRGPRQARGEISHRGRIRRLGESAASWWNAWLPGHDDPWRIEVASVVHGRIEVRCVLIDGPEGVMVRHGGYAIADERRPDVEATDTWAQAVRPDRLTSVVVGLHGYDEAGVRRDLDTNAFGPHSATPYLVRRCIPAVRCCWCRRWYCPATRCGRRPSPRASRSRWTGCTASSGWREDTRRRW